MEIRPFDVYSKAYPNIDMTRGDDGVLEMQMHTDDGPMIWGESPHGQLANAYTEIAADNDNKLVILSGRGDQFIRGMRVSELPSVTKSDSPDGHHKASAERWSFLHYQGKRLMQSLLDIEVPMIAVVNGSVAVHSEQALLCDIVLAADNVTFKDGVHFVAGLLPGDGVHVIYTEAMGINRARYFLLTGQEINAQQALDWGLVNELLPADQLMARARELAAMILEKPPMVVRLTRQVLVQDLKKRMLDDVGYGIALESLAATEFFPQKA
jgi:enoyl-CoA hydratase/carnithine racemase